MKPKANNIERREDRFLEKLGYVLNRYIPPPLTDLHFGILIAGWNKSRLSQILHIAYQIRTIVKYKELVVYGSLVFMCFIYIVLFSCCFFIYHTSLFICVSCVLYMCSICHTCSHNEYFVFVSFYLLVICQPCNLP